jgi:hypothetical protein
MTSVNQVKAFIRALERQIKGPGFYPLEAECEVIAARPVGASITP